MWSDGRFSFCYHDRTFTGIERGVFFRYAEMGEILVGCQKGGGTRLESAHRDWGLAGLGL